MACFRAAFTFPFGSLPETASFASAAKNIHAFSSSAGMTRVHVLQIRPSFPSVGNRLSPFTGSCAHVLGFFGMYALAYFPCATPRTPLP